MEGAQVQVLERSTRQRRRVPLHSEGSGADHDDCCGLSRPVTCIPEEREGSPTHRLRTPVRGLDPR